MNPPYSPISCDYVDWIEHLATLKIPVVVQYIKDEKLLTTKNTTIKTWENDGTAEYLILYNGIKIRFDFIKDINGKCPGSDCTV